MVLLFDHVDGAQCNAARGILKLQNLKACTISLATTPLSSRDPSHRTHSNLSIGETNISCMHVSAPSKPHQNPLPNHYKGWYSRVTTTQNQLTLVKAHRGQHKPHIKRAVAAKMSTLLWAFFWICFVLISNSEARPLLGILFLWLVSHMITTNNQMSQDCWFAFWLSFLIMFIDLHAHIDLAPFGTLMFVSTVVYLFTTHDYTIPTAVYWVLFCSLATTVHGPTLGGVFWYTLVIMNLHLNQDGTPLLGLRTLYLVMAAFVVAIVLLRSYISYGLWYVGVVVLISVITIGVLHNQMWPYNKEFGWRWAGAWFLLLLAFEASFAPGMPPLWYPMLLGIVVYLGFAFRPDLSLGRFTLWLLTIFAIRMALYSIYHYYFLGFAVTADVFPFTLFRYKWRISRAKWQPLASRNLDSLNHTTLCEKCDILTRNSNLIMGSLFSARLVEWHEFWAWDDYSSKFKPSVDEAALNADSNFLESSCHLCCILWYSISPKRRDKLTADAVFPKLQGSSNALRIKIWEDRPLSPYTYLQLCLGESAVGARLLVHRDDFFPSRKFHLPRSTHG